MNAEPDPVVFRLPPRRFGLEWALELSTAHPDATGETYAGAVVASTLPARSLTLAPQKPRLEDSGAQSTPQAIDE